MKIQALWRYLKFQIIYKRRFSKTPGIPTLCSNLKHPYHESKFEQETCNVLCSICGNKEVLVPSQHKYPIKFDFIIKGTSIIEPHGIWTNKPGEDSFFDYYKQRRTYADNYDELKEIPVVVLSNLTDLTYLKKQLKESSNFKKTCQEVTSTLLEKYKTNELPPQQETVIRSFNIWIVVALLVSLIVNIYFVLIK